MAINNPQTWTRIRRLELRNFANHLGNETLRLILKWPQSKEPRAIKEITESVARRLDGQQQLRDIDRAFHDLTVSANDILRVRDIEYYNNVIGRLSYKTAEGRITNLDSYLVAITSEVYSYIKSYNNSLPPPPTRGEIAAAKLAEIVPDQKVGPASFELVNGVIQISHRSSTPRKDDNRAVEASRAELLDGAEELERFLTEANHDKRLIVALQDMRSRLASNQDIIRLGIAAISLQILSDRFENELPNFWNAKLQAFSIGVGMFVGQFPEWARFSENAANADYSAEDVVNLQRSGATLVEELRQAGQLVDPEVPQTLAFLLEAINDPRRAVRRTVYSAIRTVENLVSVIFRSFGVALSGVPEGLKDGVRKGVTVITVSSLLLVAATASVNVAPAASRMLQTNWLGKAGKIILESLNMVK